MKRIVSIAAIVSGCATTDLQTQLAKNQCEQAETTLAAAFEESKKTDAYREMMHEYVITPVSYTVGYTLSFVTLPIYVAGQLVAVPVHDAIQLSHDAGIYPHYTIDLSRKSYSIKGKGFTAAHQGHRGIHLYGADVGLWSLVGDIAREPLTTQRWRESWSTTPKTNLRVLYANQLFVGQCFAQRMDSGDTEKSLAILRQFESDPNAPSFLALSHAARDAYRDLKTLENPAWAAENPKTYGPTNLGLQLRGIFLDEAESVFAH